MSDLSDTSADDDDLLGELRVAVDAADPVPARLLAAARAAYAWRTIDEELATLQYDSLTDLEMAVRSGGAKSVVHLSFATPNATVEVDLSGNTIDGLVVPPATRMFLVLASGERVEIDCDELGRFGLDRSVSGPIRLAAHLPGGDVVTEWFTI